MKALAGLPGLSLRLGGGELGAEEMASLESVRVTERLSLPAQCELSLVNPPRALAERRVAAGAPLLVHLQDGATLFEGEVTALELAFTAARQREVRVRAYDRLHRLRRRQPVRALAHISVAELAAQLCGDAGLSTKAAEGGPRWPWIVQWRQTDLELLTDLAMRAGLYLAVRGDVVHLVTLAGLGAPVALSIDAELLECSIELNGDGACDDIAAAGWDLGAVVLHGERASGPRVAGRPGDAFASPVRSGRTLGDEPAPAAGHAKAAAQAELDRRAARTAILRGVAEGDPRLRPGAKVELRGVPDPVGGRYVLCAVDHVIDARRGFVSEISSEPPAPPPRARAAAVTAGRVTRVDGKNGRVKVELPSLGKVESDWLQVLAPGAGAGKGLTALPDAGDTVLLLLAHGDPAQAVVLGGLYDAAGPKDAGVVAGAVRRSSWRSAAGHLVQLDDERRTLRIEAAGGSELELSPEGVRLSAGRGKRVVIRGGAIDFERG